MRRKGWWHAPVLIVLAALLCIALLVLEIQERGKRQSLEQVRGEAEELELKRDRLLAERDRGERRCSEMSRGPATEQLLFLDLDQRIYTQVYPLMRERGISGVLALSVDCLPGMEGKLSRQNYDELLSAGWETCLICTDSDDLTRWDGEISASLEQAGLTKPQTVYFPAGSFRRELQEELLRLGYHTAVHHGENGLSQMPEELEGELWMLGAHPWNYSGVKTDIQAIAQRGAAHCFTVSFSEGNELYLEEPFQAMLDYLKELCADGEFCVAGFEEGRRLQNPAANGAMEIRAAWEQERAEIEAQILELDRQIRVIYEKWTGD